MVEIAIALVLGWFIYNLFRPADAPTLSQLLNYMLGTPFYEWFPDATKDPDELAAACQDDDLASLPAKTKVKVKSGHPTPTPVEPATSTQDNSVPLQVVTSSRRRHSGTNVDGIELHSGYLVDEAVSSTSIASDTTANAGPHSDLWHDDVGFSDFKPDTVLEPTL